jgi:spore maturation protein CgeB
MRTFEIPASNAFMLSQRTDELAKKLFVEGKNIICFETLGELEEKVVRYLEHPEERYTLTQRTWKYVQNYTLKRQLVQLIGQI